MKPAPTVNLTAADIAPFASRYLHEGRKHENWTIEAMEIADRQVTARVKMTSTFVSSTDAKGFHLTIFSTLEFLSEMMIVYGHVWAGYKEKTREGWMVECSSRNVRAIRDPECIEIEMTVKSMRQRSGTLFCVADYRVTDPSGGLFEVSLKGFLS